MARPKRNTRSRFQPKHVRSILDRASHLNSAIEDTYGEDKGLWYQTPAQVERQLEWGREKTELMCWTLNQMRKRLTGRERRSLELYYFEGRSYREVAAALRTTAPVAYRIVQDAIRKLRAAAAQASIRVQPPKK